MSTRILSPSVSQLSCTSSLARVRARVHPHPVSQHLAALMHLFLGMRCLPVMWVTAAEG